MTEISDSLLTYIKGHSENKVQSIIKKVISGERISIAEGIELFKSYDLGVLGILASLVKEKKHGDFVFYNKNLHIEPTNVCIYNCLFCNYSRKAGETGSYKTSKEEILRKIESVKDSITEVHIVGGVHPDYDLEYYCNLFGKIKNIAPKVFIKALTAIELNYIFDKAGVSIKEGLKKLIGCGLDAIPGGGAEIFNEEIRKKVCKDKASSGAWLAIHEAAHELEINTNATMLFGHIESYEHRVDHLDRLRDLQDKTHGFNAFIPLKFRNFGKNLLGIPETSPYDVLKTFAISRIYLDNIPHIKVYWPDMGKGLSQLALSFGADDLDGTVDNTKIYVPNEENKLCLAEQEIIRIIEDAGMTPVERDTNYTILKVIRSEKRQKSASNN